MIHSRIKLILDSVVITNAGIIIGGRFAAGGENVGSRITVE